MADYSLVRKFLIDDGQLDGIPANQVFVLGYELACIDAMIGTGEGFTKTVHAENRERIEWQLNAGKRKYVFAWMEADVSESWLTLTVESID